MALKGRRWEDLFPAKWSFLIFVLYMVLFINQGILVTASQSKSKDGSGYGYKYNTVVAVLLTELIKLWVSAGVFVRSVDVTEKLITSASARDNAGASTTFSSANLKSKSKNTRSSFTCFKGSLSGIIIRRATVRFVRYRLSRFFNLARNSASVFVGELRQNTRVFFLYFIPAGLYCMYNNLTYKNLANFDPTTYFLLLQFRVVVTGIVFQILFSKRLSKFQWLSLILLTIGCMFKELKLGWLLELEEAESKGVQKPETVSLNAKKLGFFDNPVRVFWILFQVFCSSSAGVYNEFLLKRSGSSGQKQLPVLIQNVCLYIDSIICNLALLAYEGNISAVMNMDALKTIVTTPIFLAVVLNNAAIGIVTSFFLAKMNSILKTFASALELVFTAVLSWIIFDFPVHFNTFVAIVIVTLAIWLYSKEPVHNPAPTEVQKAKEEEEDMQKMLDREVTEV